MTLNFIIYDTRTGLVSMLINGAPQHVGYQTPEPGYALAHGVYAQPGQYYNDATGEVTAAALTT